MRRSFGDIQLFAPSVASEVKMRAEAEQHLRGAYAEGIYVGADAVNPILRRMFDFYLNRLTLVLAQSSSRHLLQFVLHQYDLSCEVDAHYKRRLLSEQEDRHWEGLAPCFRRATKYLAERIVMSQHREAPACDRAQVAELADLAYICSESIARLYLMSDQTVMLFPDDTRLEIFPPQSPEYMWLTVENSDIEGFGQRVRDDAEKYIGQDVKQGFTHNLELQESILGLALLEAIGASWIQAMQVIYSVVEGAVPPVEGFPIPFIEKEAVIREVSRARNLPRNAAAGVLRGFSVTREDLVKEEREIFRPKQEHRAFRRGFLEYDDEAGLHLIFSKGMAREAAVQLVTGAAFQKLPREWVNTTVRKAQAELSNRAGAWFEKEVLRVLNELGILGIVAVKSLLADCGRRIDIESAVGEIDVIGYDPRESLLIIAECKFVDYSIEPRFFRSELDNFANGPDSHFSRFVRKVGWLRENLCDVARILQSKHYLGIPVQPDHVASVMLTYYPSIATHFANEFPCLTVLEFSDAWSTYGRWPFELGKWQVHP